jgi:tRNA pseudouridine38-40 synthase
LAEGAFPSHSSASARVIRIDLEYDGTDFRGFAPQPGARTVGGELEGILARVCGEAVRVTPGGRTDSGVHAVGQVVSFRTHSAIATSELMRALNALIGADLYVRGVSEADERFDARRSARTRRYGYAIWNAPERNLWRRRWMVHVETGLDADRMNAACQALVGKHDFAAFRTHKSQDPPGLGTVRRVHSASWSRDSVDPNVVRFEIEADAYLRHMVRTIVGSAILVGEGKLTEDAITQMLERRERAAAGPTAPANGLTLLEVTY